MTEAREIRTTSPAATLEFARAFAAGLSVGDCVVLEGELGAGKTVLARGIAEGLGLADGRLVSSPTFVLVHEYPAGVPVFHLDLYRMSDPSAELEDLGFREMLQHGVVLIEWGSRAEAVLPRPHWRLSVTATARRSRRIVAERIG